MKDEQFMHLALQLAQRGCGWTAPNPMVGAVIVKDGRIIGQGWHQRCGSPTQSETPWPPVPRIPEAPPCM